MNLITTNSNIIFMSKHGGGGNLSLGLTAPIVNAEDAQSGDSVTFTMLAEPPEQAYAETRLYRYNPTTGSFSTLDATFAPGESAKTVSGLACGKRYAWLPAAFDVEGNYLPAAVLTVRVSDGSAGLVESLKNSLIDALRADPVLAAYHPQWGNESPDLAHVLGQSSDTANSGRAPYMEVETHSVTGDSPFMVKATYRLRLVTLEDAEAFADDVWMAVLSPEAAISRNIFDIQIKRGQIERQYPLQQIDMLVEISMARKA